MPRGQFRCYACKHSLNGRACAAFPLEIPLVIWSGDHDHRNEYPGDNGIRFEPIAEDDGSDDVTA